MKKLALLFVGMMVTASLAFANHCPKEMKKIDEALKTTTLSGEQLAEVKTLRKEGEDLHKEGKHKESLEKLEKAEKMLGIM